MKDVIDKEIKQWMTIITKAAEKAFPQNKSIYFIYPQETDLIKILENTCIQIKNQPVLNREHLDQIKNIQTMLKEESLRLYQETWSNKIKMQENYRDPKVFWNDVRKLMGGTNMNVPYSTSSQGSKLYNDKER